MADTAPAEQPPKWFMDWLASQQPHPAPAVVTQPAPVPWTPLEVPASWFTFISRISAVIAAAGVLVTGIVTGVVAVRQAWNHTDVIQKTEEVKKEAVAAKDQSAENSTKIDAAKDLHAKNVDRLDKKVDGLNKKTEEIKKATIPPKPAVPTVPKP